MELLNASSFVALVLVHSAVRDSAGCLWNVKCVFNCYNFAIMHKLQTEMKKNGAVPQQLGALGSQHSALCTLQLQICADKTQAKQNALMDRGKCKGFYKALVRAI